MADWGALLQNIGNAIGEGLSDIGAHTAKAAAQANNVSAQAQSAQGAFNQQSANLANSITDNRILGQYGYNSAMMSAANDYNTGMWQQAANWNEAMWERQAEFNREEAEKQRAWQEHMANTQYQRAVGDMEKAGLNPILAVTGGGVGTGVPGGATASVGGASMSSASSAMTSGGLIGAESASVGNYQGQMEYMSGVLGLISALVSGISTATKAASGLDNGPEILEQVLGAGSYNNKNGEHIAGKVENFFDGVSRKWNNFKEGVKSNLNGEPYYESSSKSKKK